MENIEYDKFLNKQHYEVEKIDSVRDDLTADRPSALEKNFVTTGFMFWYHHLGDVHIRSLSGRVVIISLFFGIFVLHELYLASILDSLINAKQAVDPFTSMNYDEFINNPSNRLGCPDLWNQCEMDYSTFKND